jgi:hypothetical protein
VLIVGQSRTTSRLVRRETSLSPIAQRRKSDGPLQPLILNESVTVKTTTTTSHDVSLKSLARPRKSEPVPIVRPRTYHEAKSIGGSCVEKRSEMEEEDEFGREKKRRRVSTHLDSLTGMTSRVSTGTTSGGGTDSVLDEEALLARSKRRLQAFSFM